MTHEQTASITFSELGLSEDVLRALDDVGYEAPSSIQAQTIPHILAGRDLVGQAQTGTGKTGAFALPLLTRLDMSRAEPQVLVLVPTRELAIQVSEAFHRYAAHIRGFHVLPIYGGQGYEPQLRQLRRGAHVIVGTPGRLVDHLKRGTLNLASLKHLVLDEGDEMLRMGFLEEVEWIIQQTPPGRQIALFSATMPAPIRRIAGGYLDNPVEVTIREKTATAATIRQRYWMVSGIHKIDALTRILEGEVFDAMLIFVRTRTATIELAEKLEARGIAAAPLSGDIPQKQREITVDRLRRGDLDLLVATDVAARGLDVSRISHVVNYDIPYDTESYIHRIGRTGRAGRTGEAILFVTPRERRLLLEIEKATRQKIELMDLPTVEAINDIRVARFKERIAETLAVEDLGFYYQLIEEFRRESNMPAIEIAAALAKMAQGDTPLLIPKKPEPPPPEEYARPRREESEKTPKKKRSKQKDYEEALFRVEVGSQHGVKPGQIVGAIANESGLDGEYIGSISIYSDYTTVSLPADMPSEIMKILKKARVCGRPLKITRLGGEVNAEEEKFWKKKKTGKKKPKKK